jgi:hypothetical protein
MAFKFLRQRIHRLRDELRRVRRFRKLPDRLATFEEAWKRHLPAFLNAVSSVGAMGHELRRQRAENAKNRTDADAKIDDLRRKLFGEIEALRTEVFAQLDEFRTRQNNNIATGIKHGASIVTNVVDMEKFHSSKTIGAKLNMGSGHLPLDSYLNIDTRLLPGVDVVTNLDDLPFDPQSVAEIYSHYVLARFTRERLCKKLLPYWRNLLRPGGTFRAVVPDAQAMAAALIAGEISFEDFRQAMIGAPRCDGDFRCNFFSAESLTQILREAGFEKIELIATCSRSDRRFDIEIAARNPLA